MKRFIHILFLLACNALSAQNGDVLTIAERMPFFPGGMRGALTYFQKNTLYPAEARENGYSGTAIVQFMVDTNGKIQAAQIIKSSGQKSLNDEAIRVVSTMPKWNSGFNFGKKVNVYVNLPVSFSIGGSSDKSFKVLLSAQQRNSQILSSEEKNKIDELNKANYYYYQGIALADRGEFKSALAEFDKSLIFAADFVDALYNKAVSHFNLNEQVLACTTWKKILEVAPEDKEVVGLINEKCNQY